MGSLLVEITALSLERLMRRVACGATGRSAGFILGGAVSPLPAPTILRAPPARGRKETVDSVTSRSMPRPGVKFIENWVPRMPAVPTGVVISKLDFALSFLVLTTMSPISRSIRMFEALGSSFSSARVPAASKGSCKKASTFIVVFSPTVTRVPLLSRRMASPPSPVAIACPSVRRAPGLIFSDAIFSPCP